MLLFLLGRWAIAGNIYGDSELKTYQIMLKMK